MNNAILAFALMAIYIGILIFLWTYPFKKKAAEAEKLLARKKKHFCVADMHATLLDLKTMTSETETHSQDFHDMIAAIVLMERVIKRLERDTILDEMIKEVDKLPPKPSPTKSNTIQD